MARLEARDTDQYFTDYWLLYSETPLYTYVVVSLPYSIPQPVKSIPFYTLQLSLKDKALSGEISLKSH